MDGTGPTTLSIDDLLKRYNAQKPGNEGTINKELDPWGAEIVDIDNILGTTKTPEVPQPNTNETFDLGLPQTPKQEYDKEPRMKVGEYLQGLGSKLKASGASLGEMVTEIPQGLEAVGNLPSILLSQAMARRALKRGEIDKETADFLVKEAKDLAPQQGLGQLIPTVGKSVETIGDKLANGKLNEWFSENNKRLSEEGDKYDKTIIQYIKSGQFGKALGATTYGIAESLAPTLAAAFVPGGPAFLGLGTGAQQYDEVKDREDMSEAQKVANAVSQGIFEWLFEELGTKEMSQFLQKIYKERGKEGIKMAFKSPAMQNLFAKAYKRFGVWFASIHEGLSEVLTTLGQNASAKFSCEDPNRKITDGAWDSFIIGTGMGSMFAAGEKTAEKTIGRLYKPRMEQTGAQVTGPLAMPEPDPEQMIRDLGRKYAFVSFNDEQPENNFIKFADLKDGRKVILTNINDPLADPQDMVLTAIDATNPEGQAFMVKGTEIMESKDVPYEEWVANELNNYNVTKQQMNNLVAKINPPVKEGATLTVGDKLFNVTEVTDNGITLNEIDENGNLTGNTQFIPPDLYESVFGMGPTEQPTGQTTVAQQIPQEKYDETQPSKPNVRTISDGKNKFNIAQREDGTYAIEQVYNTQKSAETVKNKLKELYPKLTWGIQIIDSGDPFTPDEYRIIAKAKQTKKEESKNAERSRETNQAVAPQSAPQMGQGETGERTVRNDEQTRTSQPQEEEVATELTVPETETETPGEHKDVLSKVLKNAVARLSSQQEETSGAGTEQPEPKLEAGPEPRALSAFVKGNMVQNTQTGKQYKVVSINNNNARLQGKDKKIENFAVNKKVWVPVKVEKKLTARKGWPVSKEDQARLSRTPETFDEAVLQFLLGGGRISMEDYYRHFGHNNSERIKNIWMYSKTGIKLDKLNETVFAERPDLLASIGDGAMDQANAFVDVIRNYFITGKNDIRKALDTLQGAKEEETEPQMNPEEEDMLNLPVEIENSAPELTEDPAIIAIFENEIKQEGRSYDWLKEKAEADPGYFKLFPYGLNDNQFNELKKIFNDPVRLRKIQEVVDPAGYSESRSQRDDTNAGVEPTEGRGPGEETEEGRAPEGREAPAEPPEIRLTPETKIVYTSAEDTFQWPSFVEREVTEYHNYTLDEVNKWKEKYGITDEDDLIWVTPDKWMANRYNLNAEDWETHRQVPEDQLEIREINLSDGFIIPESDDGDNGYLFVYRKPVIIKAEPETSGTEQARAIVQEISSLEKPSKYLKDLTLPNEVESFFNYLKKSPTSKYTWSVYGKGFKPFNAYKIKNFFLHVHSALNGLPGDNPTQSAAILGGMGFDLNLVEKAEYEKIWFKNGVFLAIESGKFKGDANHFYAGTQVSLEGVVEKKLMELVDKGLITQEQAYEIEGETKEEAPQTEPETRSAIRVNPEAIKYINAIRNENKKAYAKAYHNYILKGKPQDAYPEKPEGLGEMGAQSVRMELRKFYPEVKTPIEAQKPEFAGEMFEKPKEEVETPTEGLDKSQWTDIEKQDWEYLSRNPEKGIAIKNKSELKDYKHLIDQGLVATNWDGGLSLTEKGKSLIEKPEKETVKPTETPQPTATKPERRAMTIWEDRFFSQLESAYSVATSDWERNKVINDIAYSLAGPNNVISRQQLLEYLTGNKPTKANAGVTVLAQELKKWIKERNIPELKSETEAPEEKPTEKPEETPEKAPEAKEYRYKMTARPFDVGTYPKEGFVRSENDPEGGYQILVYNKKLTPQEWSKWDFLPIDEINALKGKEFKDKDGYYSKITLNWYGNNKGANVSLYDTDGNLVEQPFGMSAKDILKNIEDGEWIAKPSPLTNKPFVYTKERYPFLTDEEIAKMNDFKANPNKYTREDVQPIFDKIDKANRQTGKKIETQAKEEVINPTTLEGQIKNLKLLLTYELSQEETQATINQLKDLPNPSKAERDRLKANQLTYESNIPKIEKLRAQVDNNIIPEDKVTEIRKAFREKVAEDEKVSQRILRLQDQRDAKEKELQKRNELFGDRKQAENKAAGMMDLFAGEELFKPTSENLQSALKPFNDAIKKAEEDFRRNEQLFDEKIDLILKGAQTKIDYSVPVEQKAPETALEALNQAPKYQGGWNKLAEVLAIDERTDWEAEAKDKINALSEELNTPVIIINNRNELPRRIQAEAKRTGIWNNQALYGVRDSETGSIYIILDELYNLGPDRGLVEAVKTVLHEVVAHKGLPQLLGEEEYNRLLDEIYESIPRDDKLLLQYDYGTKDRITIAKEYLAMMAEDNVNPNLFQRILAKIRQIIRKLFKINYTTNDIHNLLRESRKNLQKSKAGDYEFAGDYLNSSYRTTKARKDTVLGRAAEAYQEKEAVRTGKETIQGIREYIQDMNLPVRKFEEEVLKRGGVQDNTSKPYRDMSLSFGRQEKLYTDYFNNKMKPILEAVANIKREGIPGEEILPYIIAKHAQERNPVFRGRELREWVDSQKDNISLEEIEEKKEELKNKDYSGVMGFDTENKYDNPDKLAADIVKEFEDQVDKKLINDLWSKINDATSSILDTWEKGGQISPEQKDEYLNQFHFFVPLRGWREGAAKELVYTKGEGFSRSLQHAEGRKSLADNPLAYLLNVEFQAITEQVDNEVKTAMYNLILKNLKNNEIHELATIKKLYYVKIILPDGSEEWEPTINRPPQEMFDSGDAKTKIYHEYQRLRKPRDAREHEVLVRKPGGDMVLVFKGKQLSVAQALNKQNYMYRTIFGHIYDARDLNKVMALMGNTNNMLKALYTSWNVVFPFTNFIRDFQEASITQSIKSKAGKKVLSSYKDAFPAIMRRLKGEQDLTKKIDQDLEDFYNYGGATGYTHMKTPEEIEKDINNEIRKMVRKGTISGDSANTLADLARAIEQWNRLFEDATRFSVYLSSLAVGNTKEDAAYDAKEASVNFNRKGKGSKAWDAWFAFFNVAIQSMQKNFKLAKDYPGRFSKVAFSFVMLGFLEALMNAITDDPDDPDSSYYNLNPYMRQNYLIIPLPKLGEAKKSNKYFSVPLPQFWRGFKSIGSISFDVATGKMKVGEAVMSALGDFAAALLPIDVGGFFKSGEFSLAPIFPTIIKPVVELAENRNYMGYTIKKEPFTREQKKYLANAGLGKDNVNPAAKFFTDLLFRWSGGDTRYKYYVDQKGRTRRVLIDINPSSLEHLITGYTGGTGGVISDLITTVVQALKPEEELDFKNIPFVNRFIRQTPEAKWNIISDYYNIKSDDAKDTAIQKEYERKAHGGGDATKYVNMSADEFRQIRHELILDYDKEIKDLTADKTKDDVETANLIIELMDQCVNQVKDLEIQYKKKY